MSSVEIRAIDPSDIPLVSGLLDTTLGEGFWELDLGAPGCHVVAVSCGEIVGAASATIVDSLEQARDLPGPVGLIRLVAVRADSRQKGVAFRLARAVGGDCLRRGASSLAALAWVYGGSGVCPLAGVLERLGFARRERLMDFYAGVGNGACPQCGCDPCSCTADLYVALSLSEEAGTPPLAEDGS